MALFKAAIVILLTLTPMLLDAYPVAQSAENKGRGRSYPVIISQYSNVRNSKYNEPERTTTEAAKPNVVEVVKEEAQPPTNQVVDLDVAANPTEEKKSEPIPADAPEVAVQTEETKIEADATPVDDAKKVETVEPANQEASSQTGSEAAKVITDSKNESSPAAIPPVDSTAAVADVAAVEISKVGACHLHFLHSSSYFEFFPGHHPSSRGENRRVDRRQSGIDLRCPTS